MFYNNFGKPKVPEIMAEPHKNQTRTLEFSKEIKAIWLRNFDSYQIDGRTVVINLGSKPFTVNAKSYKKIWPRNSTVSFSIWPTRQVLLVAKSVRMVLSSVTSTPLW